MMGVSEHSQALRDLQWPGLFLEPDIVVPEELVAPGIVHKHYYSAPADCAVRDSFGPHFLVEQYAFETLGSPFGVSIPGVQSERRFVAAHCITYYNQENATRRVVLNGPDSQAAVGAFDCELDWRQHLKITEVPHPSRVFDSHSKDERPSFLNRCAQAKHQRVLIGVPRKSLDVQPAMIRRQAR